MDGKGFQVWLSAARGLTRAQRAARRSRCCRAGAKAMASNDPVRIKGLGRAIEATERNVRTARAKGRFRRRYRRGVCGATSARAAAEPSTR